MSSIRVTKCAPNILLAAVSLLLFNFNTIVFAVSQKINAPNSIFRLGPHTVLTFIVLEQMNRLYRVHVLGLKDAKGGGL